MRQLAARQQQKVSGSAGRLVRYRILMAAALAALTACQNNAPQHPQSPLANTQEESAPAQEERTEGAATSAPPAEGTSLPQTAVPGPVASAPQAAAPEPVASVPQTAAPEPVVSAPQTAAPGPVASAPQAAAPEPVVSAPQAAAPEPAASALQAAAPEPVASAPQALTVATGHDASSDYTVRWLRPLQDRNENDGVEIIDHGWWRGVQLLITSSAGNGAVEVQPVRTVWRNPIEVQFQYAAGKPFNDLERLNLQAVDSAPLFGDQAPDPDPAGSFVVWRREGALRVALPAGWLHAQETLHIAWADRMRSFRLPSSPTE